MDSKLPTTPKICKSDIPYRQIRALQDDDTIMVYQAYSASIAEAAVREQKLDASPDFLPGRMTWIKPSWCWMMYRSGYTFKDARQARVLALRMRKEHFRELLMQAVVCGNRPLSAKERIKDVRVQWDPERSPNLGMLGYRSIQIGVSGEARKKWVDEWIIRIEDVTERALGLRRAVEETADVPREELEKRGLVPAETVYEVDEKLRRVLKMDISGE